MDKYAKENMEIELKDLKFKKENIIKSIENLELKLRDEKLYFLRDEITDNDGIDNQFELLKNDDDVVIYYAYDCINPEIRYEINVTDNYARWYFTIKLHDIRQGVFEIEKKIMSFEHFIEYMVKPFIIEARYDI